MGLLYHDSVGVPLVPGQKLKGFVRTVRADGRLDLSLDAAGYQRVRPLKQQIVDGLEQNGGPAGFGGCHAAGGDPGTVRVQQERL